MHFKMIVKEGAGSHFWERLGSAGVSGVLKKSIENHFL